jgi:hypothetical protein
MTQEYEHPIAAVKKLTDKGEGRLYTEESALPETMAINPGLRRSPESHAATLFKITLDLFIRVLCGTY